MAKPFSQRVAMLAVAFAVKAALAQTPPAQPEPEIELEEEIDVAAPGGLVVLEEAQVTSRRRVDVQQATTQVVSVLSSEDIARTGEGDIAGALAHVPGLSVVGGGFVYVRGLGDRYSLALLNGSPLPSPEPLRRAIPLDLFPTDVIASSLVQKTYSPNFTGEFGGGVINLTTLAIPKQPFLKFGAGISANSETTNGMGLDHFGGKYDWTGFDGGARNVPSELAAFFASGQRISAINSTDADGHNPTSDIAKQFVGPNNGIVQQIDKTAPNYSGSITGGTSWTLDSGSQFGVIATAGYSNDWRTRDNLQQSAGSTDLSSVNKDYRNLSSENHLIANGLLGLAYESGENQLRWTNLYIHDTLKRTALAMGTKEISRPGAEFAEQSTGWYERELQSSQLAGTLKFDPVTIDARVAYSKSKREAPYELDIGYTKRNTGLFGDYYVNRLDNGVTGFAKMAFSDLSEDLISAGFNLGWRVAPGVVLSTGYDYAYTSRESARRLFQISAPSSFPTEIGLLRPDLLLAPAVIEYYDIGLIEETESAPAFEARMLTHGAYGQVQAQLAEGLELALGARYEQGKQVVRPVQVFTTQSGTGGASTHLDNDYILPAATLTYKFGDSQNQQLRFNISKTIARPQFRELMFQAYFDPEANRLYQGNPLLGDSKFQNAEARYEWYFAPEQRFSLAGFYKKIDRPIEAFVTFDSDGTPTVRYANAPEAQLYGGELEWQKYIPLDTLGNQDGGLFNDLLSQRRLVLVTNYTYTTSKINVGANDTTDIYGGPVTSINANLVFADGSKLTGQSDHIVNLQLGLERPDKLSQQTLVLSYASDRVTSRGGGCNSSNVCQPDIYESPGLIVNFVARQGVNLFGQDVEFKLEARNLFGHRYSEFQRNAGNTIYYNRYDTGRTYSASFSLNF